MRYYFIGAGSSEWYFQFPWFLLIKFASIVVFFPNQSKLQSSLNIEIWFLLIILQRFQLLQKKTEIWYHEVEASTNDIFYNNSMRRKHHTTLRMVCEKHLVEVAPTCENFITRRIIYHDSVRVGNSLSLSNIHSSMIFYKQTKI